MNQYSMFENISDENKNQSLKALLSRNDIKGIVNYLSNLPENDFRIEVLKSGFQLISFNNGKNKVIQDVIDQIKE